jgi:hypothetical protein
VSVTKSLGNRALFGPNRLKLGIFGASSSSCLAATAIAFVDYLSEFLFFKERALPRLERAGLRHPPGTWQ